MSRYNPELQKAAEEWGLVAGQDILDLKGKIYITYAGILKHAHAKAERPLRAVRVSDPQSAGDTVWMRCTVEVQEPDGTRSTFEGIGDSFSTPKMIPPIRMAETRAKARALRTAYAIPFVAQEEMGADIVEAEPRQAFYESVRKDVEIIAEPPSGRAFAKMLLEKERDELAKQAAKDKADATPSDAKEVVISMQEVAQVFEKIDTRTQAISEVGEQIRKTSLARIHAAARDVALDHAGLKALLPSDWSLTTVPQATLDALSGLLSAKHLDPLREMWAACKMAELEKLKDYMKARLSAKSALSAAVCKGEQCGKEILWGVSEKQGTRTPVEVGPIRSLKGVGKSELLFILTEKGTLLLTHTYPVQQGEAGVQTYLSHHSTCPNAPHFRAKKEAA